MLYALVRLLGISLFKILFCFKVYGRENIPKKGGCILASNHLSFLDPVALAVASHRVLHFMTRDDLFTLPIFGKFISLLNTFPVKRGEVDIEVIKEALRRLAKGRVVALFPEGRRRFNGTLGPAELGVGFLAWRSKVKIIPAYIKGSDLALPQHAKFIRLKKVSVYFGKPLTLDPSLKRNKVRLRRIGLDGIIDSSAEKKEVYQEIADGVMQSIAQLKQSSLT